MHHFDYDRLAVQRGKLIPYPEVEKFMELMPDDIILDVGAGDGFYSCSFALLVYKGKVISLEKDDRGATRIRKRISDEKIGNVVVQVADVCDGLPADGYRKVFFSNTLHDIPCRDDLLQQLHDNSTGPLELDLIEFRTDKLDMGPPLEIRISENSLKEMMIGHGFKFVKDVKFSHNYMHKYVKM